MNTELPPAIAAFFQAHNTGQTEGFNDLFTGDALVRDEGHEYRGAAIKGWIDAAIAKYRPNAEVTDLAQVGEKTIVTVQVSGTFPGSPIQLRYNFTVKNSKIAALAIGT
jgi:SnoaL-like domain